MKRFVAEFRTFMMRGNVVDLAVAVVIGAAFKAIIDAFVADIINPVIGLMFSADSLDAKTAVLGNCAQPKNRVEVCNGVVAYGHFVGQIINFMIIGLALFIVLKTMTKLQSLRGTSDAAPPEPSDEVKMLTEIRDAINARG